MLSRDSTIELHTLLQDADMEFDEDEKAKYLKIVSSLAQGASNVRHGDLRQCQPFAC